MFRKRLVNLAQLSAVSITAYYAGVYSERSCEKINGSEDSVFINGKSINKMPGLPIFGTVSAATPYTESGGAKDRVSLTYQLNLIYDYPMYCEYLLSHFSKALVSISFHQTADLI